MAIKSILSFIQTIQEFPRNRECEYFYRGHSRAAFDLLPSIYRPKTEKKHVALIKNEDKIFREMIIRTPGEFSNERTTIEKLVKMQHYGLPTRLLDVTSNPLIALYFACNQFVGEQEGEVVILEVPKSEIKYYDSDTVSVLSNLSRRPIEFDLSKCLLEYQEQSFSLEPEECIENFNTQSPVSYLLHEIKDEKPQFLPIINPSDFNRVVLVRVKLNNNRIIKQSGAFLLFGIDGTKERPARIPEQWIVNANQVGIDLVIRKDRKRAIMKDLDTLGVNESTIYPELEQQSKYIRQMFEVR